MAGRALLVLCLIAVVQRSFVDLAPTTLAGNAENEKADTKNRDEEKQLKDLKQSVGKSLSVVKTHSFQSTEIDGHQETQGQMTEQVKDGGKLVASVKQHVFTAAHEGGDHEPISRRIHTELDIPSRGIHKVEDRVLGQENGQQEVIDNVERRASNNNESNDLEKFKSFAGVQYSPLDMAEYVFWTGDERGVTLSIEELLEEGLASQNSVEIAKPRYLDSKPIIEALLKKTSPNMLSTPPAVIQEEAVKEGTATQEQLPQKNQQQLQPLQQQQQEEQQLQQLQQQQMQQFQLQQLQQQLEQELEQQSQQQQQQQQQQSQLPQSQQSNLALSDDDYDELVERLKVADFLYTEYSLEEVIYQLAKVMFSQSLTKGSLEAQMALQKFTSFLEGEAAKGHISRSLEKKVLDVLIASLTDTLTEHPHLLTEVHENLTDTSAPTTQLLRQLIMMNPASKVEKSDEGHQPTLAKGQVKDEKNPKNQPTGLEPVPKNN